jgi:hypothetical protein
MSKENSPIEDETLPRKVGDWEADAKVWMNAGCDLESTESEGYKALKITPLLGTGIMNVSIWRDATKCTNLDLKEPEWKSFVFTHANHLSELESATLALYQDVYRWEKDILPDLSADWKTLEYLLPSAAPEGYWGEAALPSWEAGRGLARIKYILFRFSGKSGKLSGSFEIKKAHLVRMSPQT